MIREIRLIDRDDTKYFICNSDISLGLQVKIDKNKPLEDNFDKLLFEKLTKPDKNNEEVVTFRNYLLDNFDNLLNLAKYIRLDFSYMDPKEYIRNNPVLKDKKVVVGERIAINDRNTLDYYLDTFKNHEDNIYVLLEENNDYVSLNTAKKTMDVIQGLANKISRLKLSPLEKVMMAYDFVVRKEVKCEDINDDRYESRDLSRVIFGEKCECAGFAHMFDALLKCLGIRSNYVELLGKGPKGIDNYGHARNSAFIYDEKYNVNGVYYFDPTVDSVIDHTKNIEQYKGFLKTKDEIDHLISERDEEGNKIEFYEEDLKYFRDNLQYEVEKMAGSFNKAYNDINKTINNMSKLVMEQEIAKAIYIYSKPSSYELRELKHKVKMLEELYRNKLNGEQYIRLLINTKIIENNVFSNICNYTLDDLFDIIDYSGWDLSETNKFYVDTDDEEIKRDSYYNFLEASKVVDNQFDYHFLKKL